MTNGFGSKMPTLFHQHPPREFQNHRLRACGARRIRHDSAHRRLRRLLLHFRDRLVDALLRPAIHVNVRALARERLRNRQPDPRRQPVTSAVFPFSFRSARSLFRYGLNLYLARSTRYRPLDARLDSLMSKAAKSSRRNLVFSARFWIPGEVTGRLAGAVDSNQHRPH